MRYTHSLTCLQTKNDLESCMDQWKDFEAWHERCAGWLKDLEARLRDVDLKSTLQEKQAQLDKLKVQIYSETPLLFIVFIFQFFIFLSDSFIICLFCNIFH